MKSSQIHKIIKEEIQKVFTEIKINDPNITWEKVWNKIDSSKIAHEPGGGNYTKILKKYGYFDWSSPNNNNQTVPEFLKTLNPHELVSLNNDLINYEKSKINENSASKLYKLEGLLVCNNKLKTQRQIFSDIRAITGVTTIDAEEYNPRLPKKEYSYDRVVVKIDPYPYLKFGKFDMDTVKQIIINIGNIRGVVKFKSEPQLINIGI